MNTSCYICDADDESIRLSDCMDCGQQACDDCYNHKHEACNTCNTKATWCQECDNWIDWETVDTELCDKCAEERRTCADCGEESQDGDELRIYNYSEWNKGYKNHYSRHLCDSCYEGRCPSIDPQEIAESMTDNQEEQEAIIDAIQNNMDTHGEIWKQLKDASIEECWKIIVIMGIARSRHENTNYDELLKAGVSRDTARELIK